MRRLLLLCTAAAVLFAGCGKDNELSGSVDELFPLEVSRVEVLRNADAMQVTYFHNREADIDIVVRVGVSLAGVELKDGKRIDLTGTDPNGVARASVTHLAAGEPARIFPPINHGDILISSGAKDGETFRGTFSMSFVDNKDYGGGRTLVGNFNAQGFDAGFGDFFDAGQ